MLHWLHHLLSPDVNTLSDFIKSVRSGIGKLYVHVFSCDLCIPTLSIDYHANMAVCQDVACIFINCSLVFIALVQCHTDLEFWDIFPHRALLDVGRNSNNGVFCFLICVAVRCCGVKVIFRQFYKLLWLVIVSVGFYYAVEVVKPGL